MFQPGRGQVFVTIPFHAAQIELLRGVHRMAQEGFAVAGVTEEGAELGCGVTSVCKYTLPSLKC